MSILNKCRKIDLVELCQECEIEIPEKATVRTLTELIQKWDGYTEDYIKDRLEVIMRDRELAAEKEKEERKERMELEEKKMKLAAEKEAEERRMELEKEKMELEEKKMKLAAEKEAEERRMELEKEKMKLEAEERLEEKRLEYELRKLSAEREINSQIPENTTAQTTTSGKNFDLLKLLNRYDSSKTDISMFLALYERQMAQMKIHEDEWVSYLLGLLPVEIASLVTRENDPEVNNYEFVKTLLLKRFKLSPEEFRQKFMTLKKEAAENWRDFAYQLKTYFQEWVRGMEVSTFEGLVELLVTDQIKRRIPVETKERFLEDLPKIKEVNTLVEKLDDLETALRGWKNSKSQKSHSHLDKEEKEGRYKPNMHSNGRKEKLGSENIACWRCKSTTHKAFQCRNREGTNGETYGNNLSTKIHDTQRRSVMRISYLGKDRGKEMIRMRNVLIDGKLTKVVVDTASEVSLINQEYYEKIGKPRLTHDIKYILSGLGKKEVIPIGSFKYQVKIDGLILRDHFLVIPKSDLDCDILLGVNAITGYDLAITESGVKVKNPAKDVSTRNQNRDYKVIEMDKEIEKNSSVASEINVNTTTKNKEKAREQRLILLDDENKNKDKKAGLMKNMEKVNHPAREKENKENVNKEINEEDTDHFLRRMVNVVSEDIEIDVSQVKDRRNKENLIKLIKEYKPNKVKDTGLKMKIILTDEIPICQRPRRFPVVEQKIIENQVRDWLKEGIIRPSSSDYAAPVVLSKKKDGSYRLCIDYRKINKKIVKDRYPLPLIEEVLDKLEGAEVFTSIDLKNGFFHVEIEESSRKYTAFVTNEGEYEFLRCPFGLCVSGNQFQRFVNTVFRDLIGDGTIVIYMDDFIIPAQSEEESLEKLARVLKVASEYGLEINFKKCQFLKRKIEFLGYIIENGKIKPSETKTLAVKNFPKPQNVKQLQSFLGLTGYFRKFVPNYAIIAKPLSDMLRKDKSFEFGPEQETAFNKLKEILTEAPVLQLFKQGAPLELHTDASSYGFGAVLLQKAEDGQLHPLHYMSRKTSPQQSKYCSYELETLAVIEALKKFRCYLMGQKFKIVTDCSALQGTLSKRELSPKVARWKMFMEDFDYEIEHRPANRMKHVDALSRSGEERREVMMITRAQHDLTSKIIAAQNRDEYIQNIKAQAEGSKSGEYLTRSGVVYKFHNGKEVLVVPKSMHKEIIKEVHNRGHFAAGKTEDIIKEDYHIQNLSQQVEEVVTNCVKCILYDRKRGKAEGFLCPIPKGDRPLSTYHIDHIGPLAPTSKQYKYIFTIVDGFTKFVWFYPVKTVTTREVIEKLTLQQSVFGNPMRIISDRGTAFTSGEFEEYCKEQGIEHVKITTGMPRGNGQVEVVHRVLIPVLAKLCGEDEAKWYKYVPKLQKIINSTVARSTKYSPFELMIGVKMKDEDMMNIRELLEEEYEERFIEARENIREEAKRNIMKIQEENKKQFDKKRKEPRVYKIGDMVAIQRTQFGTSMKLREKFLGPYRVTKVKPNHRYDVVKEGVHEGPIHTSSSAEYMKPWPTL